MEYIYVKVYSVQVMMDGSVLYLLVQQQVAAQNSCMRSCENVGEMMGFETLQGKLEGMSYEINTGYYFRCAASWPIYQTVH